MEASWLNVGSLILGLIAWGIPISVLLSKKTVHWGFLSIISFAACSIAVCFQFFYNWHLVRIEDWGALEDIIGGVAMISTILVAITIFLQFLALQVVRKQR